MNAHACAAPVALADVLAWLAGELEPAREAALEEALLSCGACSAAATTTARLVAAAGDAIRAARVGFPMTPALADRLAASGLRVRRFHASAGEVVACGAALDDDLVVTTVPAPLPPGACATLVIDSPAGRERHEDYPFDPARGELAFALPAAFVRAVPPGVVRIEVWEGQGDAARRVGAFALRHGPWPPAG